MSGWEAVAITSLVVGTTAQVYSGFQQAKAQKAEARRIETAASIDATAREIQRTKRLNAYMASINAQAGAGGVNAGVGSLGNIQSVAARENKISVATDRANASDQINAARSRASNAKRASLVNAVSSVAEGALGASQVKMAAD